MASRTRADSAVAKLSGTVTWIPGPSNAASDDVAAAVPEQVPFVKMSTCEPLSAPVPRTSGVLSLAGEAGVVPVTCGAAAKLSWV